MTKASAPERVLFLCTGNSARSILAEALLAHYGGDRYLCFSAGSHPTGVVNPLALETLREHGIDMPNPRSKSWDEFAHGELIDLVVTVCDSAASETCPVWPGGPRTEHWGIPDPAAVTGPDEERRAAFEDAFRSLEQRVSRLLGRA